MDAVQVIGDDRVRDRFGSDHWIPVVEDGGVHLARLVDVRGVVGCLDLDASESLLSRASSLMVFGYEVRTCSPTRNMNATAPRRERAGYGSCGRLQARGCGRSEKESEALRGSAVSIWKPLIINILSQKWLEPKWLRIKLM